MKRSLTNVLPKKNKQGHLVYRFDRYSLHLEHPPVSKTLGKWKLSGRDSTGSYRRVRFEAADLTDACFQTEKILAPDHAANHRYSLSDAFAAVIKTRRVKPYTVKHYKEFAIYFCKWLDGHRRIDQEKIRYWDQLRFADLEAYVNHLIETGKKSRTVKHYLEPIRFTAGWMARNWPERYHNFCEGYRLPRDIGETYVYEERKPVSYMSFRDVVEFLEWVRENHEFADVIVPGVALQGLCGLQLQEALRLTVSKVDLNEGTITIEDEVKNKWRVRRLPVPDYVLKILRHAAETAPKNDQRIVRHGGEHWKAYCSLIEGALDKWAGGRRDMPPKDFRNTLATEALNGGWSGFHVNRYLGHSPQTMAERHYYGEVRRNGESPVDFFREKVVSWINSAISNCTVIARSAEVIEVGSCRNDIKQAESVLNQKVSG